MKTQVELESLQEQLRVRKEKQYQLLEKLQGQEEAKRQAEDQVGTRYCVLIPCEKCIATRGYNAIACLEDPLFHDTIDRTDTIV